ncbi:hypothetical protein FJZ53_03510 [Candidatus Woesearchaeota archaeon]|nr:hypothetical protein [Candidatus Woesearchaeota archaeon]
MKLPQTELRILEQVSQGNTSVVGIAKAIRRSEKQVYRASQKLAKKGFLEMSRGTLNPKKASHITILLNILSEYPNLVQLLSGSGISILSALLEPKMVKDVVKETGLRKSVVYKKLKQARNISVIKQEGRQYFFNEQIWCKLKDFLEEFRKLLEITDPRVSASSVIYYKNEKEILFSSRAEQDAALTAFSAYQSYGIKILTATNYYYLPKKRLSEKEVFMHSLYVAEKEMSISHLIYIILFYLKFKKKLSAIRHPILENTKTVLNGGTINGYPPLGEIREKAEVYDIQL